MGRIEFTPPFRRGFVDLLGCPQESGHRSHLLVLVGSGTAGLQLTAAQLHLSATAVICLWDERLRTQNAIVRGSSAQHRSL